MSIHARLRRALLGLLAALLLANPLLAQSGSTPNELLEEFEGPTYQRIAHIRMLLEDGVLDAGLRDVSRVSR